MKFVLVSHNAHKLAEMRTLLARLCPDAELIGAKEAGIGEIEETGSSFEENALLKARAAAKLGYIGIADDSGLCVDALDGAPGIYSARYAGEPSDDKKNNDKLLRALREVPYGKRTAQFISVVAMAFPDGSEPLIARGVCPGEILSGPLGENGFGYDPLFFYPPFAKSFAQMVPAQKNWISHRARAMEQFAKLLEQRLGKAEG
mgnify:CR=1 FL=1|jgi:XTP/dITP diphosphohydrolase